MQIATPSDEISELREEVSRLGNLMKFFCVFVLLTLAVVNWFLVLQFPGVMWILEWSDSKEKQLLFTLSVMDYTHRLGGMLPFLIIIVLFFLPCALLLQRKFTRLSFMLFMVSVVLLTTHWFVIEKALNDPVRWLLAMMDKT